LSNLILSSKDVTDILFYKTNKRYLEICDSLDALELDLKDLALESLKKEREVLELRMELRNIEETIASGILKRGLIK